QPRHGGLVRLRLKSRGGETADAADLKSAAPQGRRGSSPLPGTGKLEQNGQLSRPLPGQEMPLGSNRGSNPGHTVVNVRPFAEARATSSRPKSHRHVTQPCDNPNPPRRTNCTPAGNKRDGGHI